MFKRVLVANRGEIALRIIRACKELDIETVAIYSEGDNNSIHTALADEAICIGKTPSKDSYLSIPRIISVCEISGVDAVHPGYGFLAENARFAEICGESGFKFIGPTPDVIRAMGDKSFAKETVRKAGVPVIPGSNEPIADIDSAKSIASKIGYPVMIKAAAGGGGRGMRIAKNDEELERFIPVAKEEARATFSDSRIYLEKFFESARHIEVQIIGDEFGSVVHLGERECSIQRRHQKLIEEAPSIAINDEMRKRVGDYACRAAKAIGYSSAGTVEFLLDSHGDFYFMEMNTRIQVEHPVTEAVTGIDIVKEQIRVAQGEKLSFKQKDIKISGHAIECRINAEDPDNEFKPSPGEIKNLYIPGGIGIRVDTHIYAGYRVLPHYDSLIAKIIAVGNTREESIKRMERALSEFLIEGIKTTVPFHQTILRDPKFIKGDIHTAFVDKYLQK